jgi:hypothetical protein
MIAGTLNCDIKGRFASWQSGTYIKVTPAEDGTAFIERIEPVRGPGLMTPKMDQMAAVPMDCIDLDPENDQVQELSGGK